MRLLKLSVLGIALACTLAACTKTETPPTPSANTTTATPGPNVPNPRQAQAEVAELYTQVCASCHKGDGSGGTADFGDGKPLKVPSLLTAGKIKDSDAEFIEQINEGGDGMPAYKTKLDEAKVKSLVAYIRTLQKQGK